MNILMGIVAVFGFLTIFFLAKMIHGVQHRRIIRAGGSCISGCVSAATCGAAIVLLLTFIGYGQLIEEQLVSHVELRRISPEEFQARLMIQGEDDRFFILRGDEWQMDAKIIT